MNLGKAAAGFPQANRQILKLVAAVLGLGGSWPWLVAAVLFALGVVCIVSRRNILYVLMGIEMILNAANLNFVAFSRFGGGSSLDGRMFAIFVIILAAAEAAIALAIVLNIFHLFHSVRPSEADLLRE